MTASALPFTRQARMSPCGTYRWTLERAWAKGPTVCYIGHNPSTASAEVDDPTSQAWVHHARFNGYGRYVAVNLYPFRAADVRECRRWAAWDRKPEDWYARDRIHDNMGVVACEAKQADIVVACWGALATDDGHVEAVIEEIQAGEAPYPDIYCLGRTLAGDPKHPMARGKHRIARDQRFEIWRTA